jgi:hypothetical protein
VPDILLLLRPLLVCLFLQVVQVYTYMLSPLMVQPGVQGGQAPAVCQQHANQQQEQPAADRQSGCVFGWQLRLVMEYADQVRTQMKPGTVNKKQGFATWKH